MHSRQLPAKAGNCGYAGRSTQAKRKKSVKFNTPLNKFIFV